MFRRSIALAVVVGMNLAACSDTRPLVSVEEGARIGKQCQIATSAVGTYSLRPAQASVSIDEQLPKASAIKSQGGTEAGAEAINRCIKARILGGQAGGAPADEPTGRIIAAQGCQQGGGALQGGSGICVGS